MNYYFYEHIPTGFVFVTPEPYQNPTDPLQVDEVKELSYEEFTKFLTAIQ